MPAVDPKLAMLIQVARKVPPERALYFAVVVKGGNGGVLIVSRRKIAPKAIQDAKKQCGSTIFYLGRCFNEDGKLAFETVKKAAPALARILKTIIARDAGLKLNVLARQAAKLTLEEVEDLEGVPEGSADIGDELDENDESLPESAIPVPEGPQPTPAKFSPVTYGHARLLWDSARKKAHAQLQQLQKAIVAQSADDPRLAEIEAKVKTLDDVLVNLDERLSDKLDAALNAAGEQRDQLHREAGTLIARYRSYIQADPLLNVLDDNPFLPVTVRKDMTVTLTTLASKLGV